MDLLNKLQNLPLRTRKIILWSLVSVLALFLFGWWVKNVKEKMSDIQKQEVIEIMKIKK